MTETRIRRFIFGLVAISIGFAVSRFNPISSAAKSQPTPVSVPHHMDENHLLARADRNASVGSWTRSAWPGGGNDPFRIVRFAPTLQASAVVHAAVAAPEKPAAPPFPYHFFGRMVDIDGNMLTFFIRDGNLLPVREGTVLDGGYHIDLVSETQVQVTYLPLNERSTIVLPSAAQ